jgi:hypothetical protein
MSDKCGPHCNHIHNRRLSRRSVLGGGAGLFAVAQGAEAHPGAHGSGVLGNRGPGSLRCQQPLLINNATILSMDPAIGDLPR